MTSDQLLEEGETREERIARMERKIVARQNAHIRRMNAAGSYAETAAEQRRYHDEGERRIERAAHAWRSDLGGRTLTLRDAPKRELAAGAVRRAPRARESRPRVAAATSSGRRARAPTRSADDDSEPDPPAAAGGERTCKGCGDPFTPSVPQRRYCSPACSDRARQRRRYDRTHARVAPEPARPFVTARELTALRVEVQRNSSRRLEVWLELPSANGNRRQLLDELHRLNDEIADGWDSVRTARAVIS